MGNNTFIAIHLALLLSPYIALAFYFPYLLYEYKTTHTIQIRKSINVYLMVILFLSAYFMTMMPFPSIETVANLKTPYTQMVPFMVIHDFFTDSGIITSDYNTFLPSLKSGAFLGPFLNVLLLMPFGYFLKEIFNFNLRKATICGFLASLLFELTQLSGLFFIYPRPYRVFDVDDLIINTIGAVAGWLMVPVVKKYSPITRVVGAKTFKKGGGISLRRRIPALLIDEIVCGVVTFIACFFLNINLNVKLIPSITRHFLSIFAIFMCSNVLMGIVLFVFGTTPGQYASGVRLRSLLRKRIRLWQSVLHTCIMGVYASVPFWIVFLLFKSLDYRGIKSLLFVAANAFMTVVYMTIIAGFMVNGIVHGSTMYYDRICRTYMSLSEKERWIGRTRQKVLARGVLSEENTDMFCKEIMTFLEENGFKRKSCVRVCAAADSALDEWMQIGLKNRIVELRYDPRLWRKTLILMVFTGDKSFDLPSDYDPSQNINVVRVSYEQYKANGAYIFAVDVP